MNARGKFSEVSDLENWQMLETKIEGLDKLLRQMKEAERACEVIDGKLYELEFDPKDEKSIQAAIDEGKRIVDLKLGKYKNNPFVKPIISGLKQSIEGYFNERRQ